MPNDKSLKKRDPILDIEVPVYENDAPYGDSYYGQMPVEGNEKQQLFKIFRVLRKYWVRILAFTLLVTAAAFVYEAQKPDFYRAQARIQVDNETVPGMTGKGASPIVFTGATDPAYFTTQLQILEGSGLLRRVVRALDLENNPDFVRPATQNAGVWENVKRMFGKPAPEKTEAPVSLAKKPLLAAEPEEDLDKQAEKLAPFVGMIKRALDVSPVQDSRTASKVTRLIEVEFTHFNPEVATKVVNTIADTYVLQNLELKVESNSSASDFLQKRVAELQTKIRLGEERLINYSKSNQILSLDANQNTVVQRLADLNQKLSAAEGERISAETSLRAAQGNPRFGDLADTKDARIAGLQGQLTTLRQELAQLKTQYTDEWPEVKRVKQQMAGIEEEIQKQRRQSSQNELAALEQTFRQAVSRENELRKYFNEQRQAVINQNEAAINYRIIQQEIDTNKSLLDGLLQKSRETDVLLNDTPNNVYVVDRALVPRSPAGPSRTKNVLLAFAASMLVGIGLAFLVSWLDDRVRAGDNVELLTGLPVIGMIPSGSNGKVSRKLLGKFAKVPFQEQYDAKTFERPMIAEAYHQLRTSLLFSTAGGEPRTILVTSGQPGEGKTVTSYNLAKSLAQLGNKVLLIDADMRCPKIQFAAGLGNDSGLSNLLTAKNLTEALINETINAGEDITLDVLTSGPQVPNPTNLLSSVQLKMLIERFSATYTHIIIDSPPVLFFADSVIIATKVDAVLLVSREGVSTVDVISQAKRRLADVRANVIGLVVNDIAVDEYQYNNYSYYRNAPEAGESEEIATLRLSE